MKKVVLLVLTLVLFVNNLQAQQGRTCGTGILPQQFETWVQSITPLPGKLGGANVQSMFYIPVIVHVIHNNEAVNSPVVTNGNNLNAAQIIDQINILNKDFNGTNTDTSLIPAVFKPSQGKFNVTFCLAAVNPTGGVLAEPGIDRINRVSKGWNAFPYSQGYIDATVKPNSIWDPNRYLNIWVCPLSNGLLGYATFPNPGPSGLAGLPAPYGGLTNDGVVSLNTSFGSIGTAQNGQYNKGRTTTHEIGHWMGLRHVWGDGTCATDYCNDTPPAQNANYNCPTFPYKLGVCVGNTTGEMTMNFMDYTDDACMYMFTKDQKNRAQLILTNSPIRASLITSTVCNLPTVTNDAGITFVASPTYSQSLNCPGVINPVINLTNFGSNNITTALISYNVDGINTQTLNWAGNLAPANSIAVSIPSISVPALGAHVFSVSVSLPNGVADSNPVNNNNIQHFTISNNLLLTVTSATTCPGVPVILTAFGANSYTWSNGALTSTVSLSPSITTVYTVSAGSGGCSTLKTTTVTIQSLPVISVNKQSVCYNTQVNITASGAPTYSWDNGSTSPAIAVTLTSPTVFTVKGFNSPQCFTTLVFTITINPLPVTTHTVNNLACVACTNGTITVFPSGGSAPYSYLWIPGNATGSSLNDVGDGCYTVTVTDANGCSQVDSACVHFDVGFRKNFKLVKQFKISPNPSTGKFLVERTNNEIVEVKVTDVSGRLIERQKINSRSFTIDLSTKADGVYNLIIISELTTGMIKLIKED